MWLPILGAVVVVAPVPIILGSQLWRQQAEAGQCATGVQVAQLRNPWQP
jgi:uncharacterized membrane protein